MVKGPIYLGPSFLQGCLRFSVPVQSGTGTHFVTHLKLSLKGSLLVCLLFSRPPYFSSTLHTMTHVPLRQSIHSASIAEDGISWGNSDIATNSTPVATLKGVNLMLLCAVIIAYVVIVSHFGKWQ